MRAIRGCLLSLAVMVSLSGCAGADNLDAVTTEELPFFSTDGFEPWVSGEGLEASELLGEDYCKNPLVAQDDGDANVLFELSCANSYDAQEDTYRVYIYVSSEIMVSSLSEWVCPANSETPVLFGENWYLPYESWMGSLEVDPTEFQNRLGGKLGTLGDIVSCQS